MDAVLMPHLEKVSLETVNEHLLERLDALISEADAASLLDIAEAVAKLNASRRNSDQFTKPDSPEARAEREAVEALTDVMRDN